MTRSLYCARSSYALSVDVTTQDRTEPRDVGRLVDEAFPGHPDRSRLIVAILNGDHARAERLARGPVEAAARQLSRLAASTEAA
jgi:hypothetical protein